MSRTNRDNERSNHQNAEQRILIERHHHHHHHGHDNDINDVDKSYNRWHHSWRNISLRPDSLLTQWRTQWNDLTNALMIACLIIILFISINASYPQVTRTIPWRGSLPSLVSGNKLNWFDVSHDTINLSNRDSLHASQCIQQYHVNKTNSIDVYQYYIAIDLHNNESIMPDFIHEMMRLLSMICLSHDVFQCTNVFISLVDHDSHDLTRKYVIMFASYLADLQISHVIISDHINDNDITSLSPLFNEQHELRTDLSYDRIIWMSGVIFCAEDIVRLIEHISHSVDLACGLAFEMNENIIQISSSEQLKSTDGSIFHRQWPWLDGIDKFDVFNLSTSLPVSYCSPDGIIVMNAHVLMHSNWLLDAKRSSRNVTALIDSQINVASKWDAYEALSSQPWMHKST